MELWEVVLYVGPEVLLLLLAYVWFKVRPQDPSRFHRMGTKGLVKLVENSSLPPPDRIFAIHELVKRGGKPAIAPLLRNLHAEPTEVAVAVVRALADLRHSPAAVGMCEAAGDADAALAVAICDAVVELQSPLAEDTLVNLLSRPEESVRIAAMTGLGKVGTIQTIREMRQSCPKGAGTARLRRVVEQAVRSIQRRHGAPGRGQLSEADVSASDGELSLADDPP